MKRIVSGNFGTRLVDGFMMFIVTAASLMLLLYVGYGDSKRTYEQIHIEKITTNGQLLQNSIEKFLRDGLPLKQYAGFNNLAGPVLEGEDVDALAVYNQVGLKIFNAVDKANPTVPEPTSNLSKVKQDISVEYNSTHYQVIIPLRTRFETVGSLVVSSSMKVVADKLRTTFLPLMYLAFGLSVVFAALFVFALPYLPRTRIPWLQISYTVTFAIMSAAVIYAIVGLYYDGVQGKSRASVVTLSQRLSDVVEFNLYFKDIEGMGRIFSEYQRLNAEVSEAALIENDIVQIATNSAKVGKKWVPDSRNFEFNIDLSRSDQKARVVSLVVTVPKDTVVNRVLRSVKNLAALFVASGLLASLFLQVAASLQSLRLNQSMPDQSNSDSAENAALVMIKPIFFLAVFLDSLIYSFLPNFMQDAAREAGLSVGYASIPFTAYYLCFALSLLPAGNLSERYGPKAIILFGLLLASVGVATMVVPVGFVELTILRGIAGVGQGMLMIGVQAYILTVASPQKKTQGVAIIVFGFQGGLIAGMALGSLLVNYLEASGVFMISGTIGVTTIFYTLMRLPKVTVQTQAIAGMGEAIRELMSDIKHVISNTEFVKTLLCVGIPAKAILTSTITFALPLLLVKYNFRSEDIGQIIMLYGVAVMVATSFASRLVDRTRNSEQVLFWGSILSGAGLMLMGLMSPAYLGNGQLGTAVMIAGTILVGFAHGFINAPVVTHVGQSELGTRLGAIPVTTSYRFLERAGHIAGPIVIAQVFLMFGEDATVLIWIGVGIACLGLLFIAHNFRPPVPSVPSEVLR
jgi:MFS family permease